MQDTDGKDDKNRSEFMDSLRKGLLIGVAILVIVVPPLRLAKNRQAQVQPPVATAPAPTAPSAPGAPAEAPIAIAPEASADVAATPQSPATRAPVARAPNGVRLADFNNEDPSPDVRQVANWVVYSKNAEKHAFVIVDKKDARVYVFAPDGRLKESAPALLGSAHGDHTVPGVGDKPLAQVKPEEKTTPAGRFVAEPGKNANGEDVVWVDYDAAVSMHRIRPLVARERRLERLASLTVDDNRISFGCINLPVSFYEDVLSPTVRQYGAVVYVLPETRTPQQLFGSFDPMQQQVALKTGVRS
jgi:hypothetical protein